MQLLRRYIPAILIAFLSIWIVIPGIVPSPDSLAYAQRRSKPAAKPARSSAKKKPAKKGSASGRKKPAKKSASKKSSSRKSSSKSRASASRSKKRAVAKIAPAHRIVVDSTTIVELADGVAHRSIRTTGGQVVNVVTVDLKRGARIRSYKAHERTDGLQNAVDIALMASEKLTDTVLAATNASFWRAGSNTPIGVTITDGEVIEMPGYKQWSSFMIYDDGTAGFDRIELTGQLSWRFRHLSIDGVNRRPKQEEGIVVYNHYYGDSLPRGSRKSDSAIIAEAFANKVGAEIGDDTEGEGIDTAGIIESYRESILLEDREFPFLKIACKPLQPRRRNEPLSRPVIDDTMRMTVVAIDTGVVAMPENGCIISLGQTAEWFSVVKPGDTISLLYTITPRQPKRVRDAITATPRLVRNGTADPEYETEGSKARRFISGRLSRTAVGVSRGGDSIFLVTVNSPNPSAGTVGMSLSQLASFMKELGAWNAMNFDGGGSASMAINEEMISRQGERPTTRRVSNALLVVKPLNDKKVPRRRPAANAARTTRTQKETAP